MRNARTWIWLQRSHHALERKAAEDLKQYCRTLFGMSVGIRTTRPTSGVAMRLSVRSPGLDSGEGLSSEAYVIERPRRSAGLKICDLVGGSPQAVRWAVFELIQQWGVHYLVHGDVMPRRAGAFRLPKQRIERQPVFAMRYYRVVNDLPHSTSLWSLSEHEKLLDQLVKLRFNGILISTYPHQPWCHWSYRGVDRTRADLDYGWQYPIHERSVGVRELGEVGRFTNPDFRHCRTYEDRIAAGRRFMHGLIKAAHARGLTCEMHHVLTSAPSEVKDHLGRWSRGVRLPKSEMDACHAHTLGLAKDDGNARFGHLMTPLNPVYVDLIESWLGAMLSEYPEIDALSLGQSEFPPSAGGIRRCWRELDRRHGVGRRFDLDAIFKQASKETFMSPGRALREAQGAVATLRLLDLVINEHRVIDRHLGSNTPITCHFMSEFLQPVVPYVFDPDRVRFGALVDYLPATVAERMDALRYVRSSPMQVRMITTLEDDNVGFLPQINTPALHQIMRKMREHGLVGYSLRHWLVSKLEPSLAYVIDAAWDRSATPLKSWRQQIERVCGRRAVKPMIAAFRRIEKTVGVVNSTIPLGFLTPGLAKRAWEDGDAGPLKQFDELIAIYDQVVKKLDESRRVSTPGGRAYVDSWRAYVRFAALYLQAVQCVRGAKQARVRAEQLAAKGRAAVINDYDKHLGEASERMAEAAGLMEQALETWREGIRDPSDRGMLAGLNAWGLDFIRAKADELRQDSEYWGLQI